MALSRFCVKRSVETQATLSKYTKTFQLLNFMIITSLDRYKFKIVERPSVLFRFSEDV